MPIAHHLRALAPAAAMLVLATVLAAAPTAQAHSPASTHGCTAPTRPADDQNDVLWQRFLDDVDAFRACVSSYAEANRRAAEIHSNAANDATLVWNQFVRAELNVPEDYPWPPQEPDVRSH
jgi:hypothetical protein